MSWFWSSSSKKKAGSAAADAAVPKVVDVVDATDNTTTDNAVDTEATDNDALVESPPPRPTPSKPKSNRKVKNSIVSDFFRGSRVTFAAEDQIVQEPQHVGPLFRMLRRENTWSPQHAAQNSQHASQGFGTPHSRSPPVSTPSSWTWWHNIKRGLGVAQTNTAAHESTLPVPMNYSQSDQHMSEALQSVNDMWTQTGLKHGILEPEEYTRRLDAAPDEESVFGTKDYYSYDEDGNKLLMSAGKEYLNLLNYKIKITHLFVRFYAEHGSRALRGDTNFQGTIKATFHVKLLREFVDKELKNFLPSGKELNDAVWEYNTANSRPRHDVISGIDMIADANSPVVSTKTGAVAVVPPTPTVPPLGADGLTPVSA